MDEVYNKLKMLTSALMAKSIRELAVSDYIVTWYDNARGITIPPYTLRASSIGNVETPLMYILVDKLSEQEDNLGEKRNIYVDFIPIKNDYPKRIITVVIDKDMLYKATRIEFMSILTIIAKRIYRYLAPTVHLDMYNDIVDNIGLRSIMTVINIINNYDMYLSAKPKFDSDIDDILMYQKVAYAIVKDTLVNIRRKDKQQFISEVVNLLIEDIDSLNNGAIVKISL